MLTLDQRTEQMLVTVSCSLEGFSGIILSASFAELLLRPLKDFRGDNRPLRPLVMELFFRRNVYLLSCQVVLDLILVVDIMATVYRVC